MALVMSPSNFSKDDPNYLGPIMFNPGLLPFCVRNLLSLLSTGRRTWWIWDSICAAVGIVFPCGHRSQL